MNKRWPVSNQVLWYIDKPAAAPCREDMRVDVAIIGGGIAGLSAAQACASRGKKVILLEQYFCGSGATGKSSGFVTPNAELSFTDFSKKFNMDVARVIWDFIEGGVADIRNTIEQYNFSCGFSKQDTLVLATSKKGLKTLQTEHDNLVAHGYKAGMYSQQEVQKHIESKNYYGGFTYENTFNINSYAYCQELKKQLRTQGVMIFEETPVTALEQHQVKTAHATITADHIIVCTDRFTPDLQRLQQEVYQVQTFLMVSQQLTDEQIQRIFPRNRRLVWDTHLIYNYICVNAQNRLILGGGSLLNTYATTPHYESSYMRCKLTSYFKKNFPELARSIQFEYMWPGLIGISKDIMPLAGPDKDDPYIYYIAAAAGLPIAAALGRYSAEYFFDGRKDLHEFFSPYRSFPIGGIAQSLIGKKLSFAFSHLIKTNIP